MRRQLKMRKPIDTVSDFRVLQVQGQERRDPTIARKPQEVHFTVDPLDVCQSINLWALQGGSFE
jgi:hypothetical protein